jgi:hypothetical protein
MTAYGFRRRLTRENKLLNTKGYRFEYVPPSADEDYGEWYPVTQEDLDFILTKCHGADRRRKRKVII